MPKPIQNDTLTPLQVYQAFREGMLSDMEEWMDMLAEDVTILGPIVNTKGKQKFIDIHLAYFETIEKQIVHKLVEHGDFVLAQTSTTILTDSNKIVTIDASEWYTIRNGKIESLVIYADPAPLRSTDRKRYEDLH